MLKKATHKHDVIVETKKHAADACCATPCKKMGHVLIILLLVLNLIIGIAGLCKKDAGWDIEEMKVGGRDNMNMVKQLYNSDVYKAQQKATIEQVLQQFQNGAAQMPTVDTTATTPTETPTVPVQ